MEIIYIFLSVITILIIVSIFLVLKMRKNGFGNELTETKDSINSLTQKIKDTEVNLKGEFSTNRKENSDNAKGLREEVTNHINTFTKTFSDQLTTLTNSVAEKFTAVLRPGNPG